MLLFNVSCIGNKERMTVIYSLNICMPGYDVERKQEAWGRGRRKEKIVLRLQITFAHKKKNYLCSAILHQMESMEGYER